eukprot:scaffold19285_cov112-Isochrysis_galbana.AAC.2
MAWAPTWGRGAKGPNWTRPHCGERMAWMPHWVEVVVREEQTVFGRVCTSMFTFPPAKSSSSSCFSVLPRLESEERSSTRTWAGMRLRSTTKCWAANTVVGAKKATLKGWGCG